MGNIGGVIVLTTDNINWMLNGGTQIKTPNTIEFGRSSLKTSYTLQQLKEELLKNKSTGKIKELYTGPSCYVYIYDKDNFQGNKLFIAPSNSFVIPNNFNLQSLKAYTVVDNKNQPIQPPAGVWTSPAQLPIDYFESNGVSVINNSYDYTNIVVIIIVLIILYLLLVKK